MKTLLVKIQSIASSAASFPIFALALCLLAYAPLINQLGLYWDDFPINWIAATKGGEGLTRYFSTNRPVWGEIYKITTPLLGSAPLPWQVFGIITRWATGLALWMLLRLVWRERAVFAAWAASLFVLYPGFTQQSGAFMYSHFHLVQLSLLLSLALMVLAQRRPRFYWPLTAASAGFGLLNLLAMEYFFLLDLMRPLLLWLVISETIPEQRRRMRRTLLAWLPYLVLFLAAIYWRSVLFGFQTYQPTFLSSLRAQPFPALVQLGVTMAGDLWKTSAGAWAKAFQIPAVVELGERNLMLYWLLVVLSGLFSFLFWLVYRPGGTEGRPVPRFRHWAWQPVGLGLATLAIAGGPFWLTGLEIGLVFPNDRFTLPFMIGASLMAAGLLAWLPLPRSGKAALLAVLLGLAIGSQYLNAVAYSRDWNAQRRMFWQLVWRIPDLQPGTTLLSNELPVGHYTDNSLSAPLNWIYDRQNNPREMLYLLFYPTLRKEKSLNNLQPGQAIHHNYLAATFQGSTDQMVSFYYLPPGCLRVLDPEIEIANWMVPNYLRETLPLTSLRPVLPDPADGIPQPAPPEHIFGAEIPRGWCYYYQKADLARQTGDWEAVARLGDEAFAMGDYPNDPIERLPFIEGYAHTGRWERSIALSQETRAISEVMQPALCRLWQRIERETQAGPARDSAIQAMQAELDCKSP